jgi:hypothetical protein
MACAADGPGTPDAARDLFSEIRGFFNFRGMLRQVVNIDHDGHSYRVVCDDVSFMVYRVNNNGHIKSHVPGWPVCFVNETTIFEEPGAPCLAQDHCSCGADAREWLNIVRRSVEGGPA